MYVIFYMFTGFYGRCREDVFKDEIIFDIILWCCWHTLFKVLKFV